MTTHPAYLSPLPLRTLAPSESEPNDHPAVPSSPLVRKKKYSCHTCRVSYKNRSSLGRHNREKHGTTAILDCRHCGKIFRRPEGVRNHIVKNRCSAASTFHDQPGLIHDAVPASPILEALPNSSNDTSLSDAMTIASVTDSSCCVSTPCPPNSVHGRNFTSTQTNKPILPQEASLTSAAIPITTQVFLRSGLQRQTRLDRAASHLSELDLSAEARLGFSSKHILRKLFFKSGKVFRMIWKTVPDQKQCERNKTWCTIPRHPCRSLFPPAFEYPPPQDLEYLLVQQHRARRRVRVIDSFRAKHCRFSRNAPEDVNAATPDAWGSRMMRHQTNIKQAWKDGVVAARQLLSGSLPGELHSVLAVAQLASAIRSTMDDNDIPVASEEKFLSDLSRWRQLLPSNSHAAFDYYADLLWENRPPSDLAWSEYHDAETLVYFQDLLMEMLSHIESSPPKRNKLQFNPPSSEATKPAPIPSLYSPSPSTLVHDEALLDVSDATDTETPDERKLTNLAELVLYSAGAIFALILAYLLRKSRSSTLSQSLLTPPFSVLRPLLGPSLVSLFHYDNPSSPRRSRSTPLVTAGIPSCKLPSS